MSDKSITKKNVLAAYSSKYQDILKHRRDETQPDTPERDACDNILSRIDLIDSIFRRIPDDPLQEEKSPVKPPILKEIEFVRPLFQQEHGVLENNPVPQEYEDERLMRKSVLDQQV